MKSLLAKTSLLMAAALAGNASAQQPPPGRDWASLNHLPKGAEIRVAMKSGKTIRGFLGSVTADSLVVAAASGQESLGRTDIRRVQSKRESHRGRNTLIGLAVGAGAGLTIGAVADSKGASDWLPNAGKIVFSSFGAIVGTVIGVAMPTGGWRGVYRAP